MRCFQTVLIAFFATVQAQGAESESELMDAFAQCRGSLTNLRSINESDRAAITNLRARFDGPIKLSAKASAARLQ